MSLRNRLWLVLGALFLVPLVVGVMVIALAVPQVKDDQLQQSLESGRAVVSTHLKDTCRLLGLTARSVGLESATSRPGLAVNNAVSGGYSDYAALLGPGGNVVAEAGELPTGSPPPQQLASCTRQRPAARRDCGAGAGGRDSGRCDGRGGHPPGQDLPRGPAAPHRDAGRDPAARRHGAQPGGLEHGRRDESPNGRCDRRSDGSHPDRRLARAGQPARRRGALHCGGHARRRASIAAPPGCSCSSCWPARWWQRRW